MNCPLFTDRRDRRVHLPTAAKGFVERDVMAQLLTPQADQGGLRSYGGTTRFFQCEQIDATGTTNSISEARK